MNDLQPFIPLLLTLILPGIFLASFVTLGGGWRPLQREFEAQRPVTGTVFRMQSAKIGWVGYRNILTMTAAREGLRLEMPSFFRLGHRPILIPWMSMRDVERYSFLSRKYVRFRAGSEGVKVMVPEVVFEARPKR